MDGERDDFLLRVNGLRTVFKTVAGPAVAVDGVSYGLRSGETLAVVGESGSGKSVTALSIMGLVPDPPGRIEAGEVWFEGRNLMAPRTCSSPTTSAWSSTSASAWR